MGSLGSQMGANNVAEVGSPKNPYTHGDHTGPTNGHNWPIMVKIVLSLNGTNITFS